jgi:tripartite-type tricarboxylate transporter receptor subunit TctC
MKKLCLILAALLLTAAVVTAEGQKETKYPSKPITVYIFSSQGGGTDVWVRHLAGLMEKDLGVSIVCNNLPGANGGTAGMKVFNAPHDGYTVLGASETSVFFGVNDVSPTAKNWEFFIGGGSPGVIAVHKDSPIKTVQDLVQAAKDKPNTVKISDSGRGKLWHIKALQLGQGAGVRFQHVPYNGSAPAITALLSKEADAVSCSAGEIAEYVRGGMARPIVMTEAVDMDFEGFGKVPAATSLYPNTAFGYKNLFQWLGLMFPADTDPAILAAFDRAFKKAMTDPSTDTFAAAQKARKIGASGKEAKELAVNMESIASWMSAELGLAKKDPASLGIAKPKE